MEKAYWLEEDALISGRPEEFFPFLDEKGHVISLVGGGGKTTLLFYLAECFAARGIKTALMTTTKIGCPQHWCETMEACRADWARGAYAVCGERGEKGKLLPPPFLAALLEEAEAIVIEADGAHRRPCKAPAAHEPVILPETDIVIAVMGLDALNRQVGEICHRSEAVQALLGCTAEHTLCAPDMAKILLSEKGARKHVEDRTFYAVLNKCDDETRLEGGRKILACLQEMGHGLVVMTSGMRRSETYESAGKA